MPATSGDEIERKFLIVSDQWRAGPRGERFRQGYLSTDRTRPVGRTLFFLLVATLGAVLGGCATARDRVPADLLTVDFIRSAVAEFDRRLDAEKAGREPEVSEMTEPAGASQEAAYREPRGASTHQPGTPATTVRSQPERLKRATPKALPTNASAPVLRLREAGQISFAASSHTPKRGLDERLKRAAEAAGRAETYAFLLLDEIPGEEVVKELESRGVAVLGRHDGAIKVRVPLKRDALEAITRLPYVRSLAYPLPEQKIAPELNRAISALGTQVDRFPLIVTLFEADREGVFAARMKQLGVTVGPFDPDLQAYSVLASREEIRALAAQDFVLFIEIERPVRGGHDQSTPTDSIDYIRAAGFRGTSTVLGILDTGFMVGSAAPTMHADLNKSGCGINFTSDAAGVWNDQNGHGTHVLGTAAGTGTATSRFRGVATGIGDTTRIRAGKIWGSTNTGQSSWLRDAMDYMDDASSCNAPRPQIVNLSGGAKGTGQRGTDSESRKLDSKVWSFRQAYIVCGGNTGPGGKTIWSPGVAKNALTVGNVRDNTYLSVGELAGDSSLGPTGDGRMKPNLVATGSAIQSALAGTTNQYGSRSGCSMATPHVTGMAATLLEHYPDFRERPHLLRAHLMASSVLHRDETAPANNSGGGRNDYGLGRVSAYQAHWARNNANGWTGHWAWWNAITNRTWGFWDLAVPGGTRRLVVVMTWDEPAASAGASSAVTYDLDLWADLGADCSPDSKGQCGEWASQSYDDNTEYLIIDNPPAGTYRLKVINWDAPFFGLPVAIAAKIVRGDPTPLTTLKASATPATAPPGSTFTVTATVGTPAYEAYGVHLSVVEVPSGVTLLDVTTTREDNVAMTFPNARDLTLGSIVQGETRTAVWRFRVDTLGTKTIRLRSWSDNGGTRLASVTVNP